MNQAALATVQRLEHEISRFQQFVLSEETAKARRQTLLNEYLMDHKLATAAICAGAAGIMAQLDESSPVRQEAKDIASGVVLVSIIYALYNAEEVAAVGSEMIKANSTIKAHDGRIRDLQQRIQQAETQLRSAKISIQG